MLGAWRPSDWALRIPCQRNFSWDFSFQTEQSPQCSFLRHFVLQKEAVKVTGWKKGADGDRAEFERSWIPLIDADYVIARAVYFRPAEQALNPPRQWPLMEDTQHGRGFLHRCLMQYNYSSLKGCVSALIAIGFVSMKSRGVKAPYKIFYLWQIGCCTSYFIEKSGFRETLCNFRGG